MEFGGEDDKDSGVGEWNFQRRPESSALWQLWSPSPAQSAGVAPVSLRRATASRLRTLQNSEGDVKPVSLSILRSIILLLLFSFFVNYKIVLINKYCPRLYLYYPQAFFFFCFLSSTTYLAFMFRSFIKVKQRPNESHSPVPVQLS